MKKYLRSVAEEFPHAAAESYHVFGWRGLYLAACAYFFRYQPLAVSLPGFGKIDSWPEAINLIDNFSLSELRSEAIATVLSKYGSTNRSKAHRESMAPAATNRERCTSRRWTR